jgi:hypothetical protein
LEACFLNVKVDLPAPQELAGESVTSSLVEVIDASAHVPYLTLLNHLGGAIHELEKRKEGERPGQGQRRRLRDSFTIAGYLRTGFGGEALRGRANRANMLCL